MCGSIKIICAAWVDIDVITRFLPIVRCKEIWAPFFRKYIWNKIMQKCTSTWVLTYKLILRLPPVIHTLLWKQKPLGFLEWDAFWGLLGFQKSLSLGLKECCSCNVCAIHEREPAGINWSFQKHSCKIKFLFKDLQRNVLLSSWITKQRDILERM